MITKNTNEIKAFVNPETSKPKNTPVAALIDFLIFLFNNISPEIAPIIEPKMIPSGGKKSPITVPTDAPIIPYLLAPNFLEV